MTKKLLASFIALSMLTVYACADDDKDDNSCEKVQSCKIDGGKIKICINKKWTDEPATAHGTCVGDVYTAGSTTPTQDPSVGTDCDATTYQATCINNNANALVCQSGKVAQWTCANNQCSKKTDNPLQVNCPKDTQSTCENPVTTAGNVGDCCDKNTYQQTCINSNANALVCWDNKVAQWECADNDCTPNTTNNLQVVCKRGNSSSGDLPTELQGACTYGTSKARCVENKLYLCGNEGKYYQKNGCEGTCFECGDNFWGACGSDINTACANHMTPSDDCVYGEYVGNCAGDVAKYCSYKSGKIVSTTCNAGQCTTCTDGFVGCNVNCADDGHDQACTGSKITEGGTDGNCCDIINYQPECKDGNKVTYCSSVGKVKTVDCNGCSVTGKEYKCN